MISMRPATIFDALEFGGSRGFLRRALLYQVRRSAVAYVVEWQGEPVALVMLDALRKRLAECAVVMTPKATKLMVPLMRAAHLTLRQIRQDGILVKVRVRPSDKRAQRLVMIAGFTPGRMRDPSVWLYR